MEKFKDQCEKCNKFDFLKGYNGKCYCPTCLKEVTSQKKEKQLNIFDMEVSDNGKQRRNNGSIK